MRAALRCIAAAALVAIAVAPGTGRAQNLLQNGSFALLSHLDGWVFDTVNADATWSSIDRGDFLLSGSAFIENRSGVAASYIGGYQCVPAEENTIYALRGAAMIPLSDENESGVEIDALWADNAFCELPALRFDDILATQVAGSWISGGATVVSPPGTTYVALDLRVHQRGEPPDFPGAYFDDLYVPEPPPSQLAGAAFGALALAWRFGDSVGSSASAPRDTHS